MTKKERKRKKKLQMKNKRLIKKYYWLMPLNAWTGKPLKDYDYTWIEWGWCKGWDKTFGQMYMDELGAAIEKSGQKNYRIVQIKEKFGQARLYDNGGGREVEDIISKYEIISENICMNCGCEAPMINDGWMSPKCFDCFKKIYRRKESFYFKKDYVPKTDEEIRDIYDRYIVDKPDENGEYHIPEKYHVKVYDIHGGKEIEYDISDTVKKIRKRISGYWRYRNVLDNESSS